MRARLGWRRRLVYAAVAAAVATPIAYVANPPATADTPLEGSQGADTSLPPTDSAVTVTGASALGPSSPFANLKLTVNQTHNLSNQAVSITWSGGTPTESDLPSEPGRFDDNYLQIFECWGTDPHADPSNPGPSPTGCEFGANQNNSSVLSLSDAGGSSVSRGLATGDQSPYAFVDPNGSGTFMPFQPADGTAPINIPTQETTDPSQPGVTVTRWANPYFDYTDSNEIDYSKTFADGTGSEIFTVDTGLESPGLGCGEQLSQPSGPAITPQCWLVIVPRGTPAQENPTGGSQLFVQTSPLSASAWANRIAIPLQFNSIGSSCQLGADERRIVGSELAAPAITNWEPKLCGSPSSPPYQYTPISDDTARQELQIGGLGAPGMAVVTNPLDPSTVNPTQPVSYAPISLSGVVVGFNIDRKLDVNTTDPQEAALVGQRVAHIYLTPRLVAKLLTESYVDQFYVLNPNSPEAAQNYPWLTKNPVSLTSDPEFLQYNPEFRLLQCQGTPDCGGPVVEQPTSDAASQVWRWILADPEAAAWLAGTPDQYGMKVNPRYSTTATVNPTGIPFGQPAVESFPKSDPYTYQNPTQLPGANNQLPRALGMQDFLPYSASMQQSAIETRTANDGAKLSLNTGALSPDVAWTSAGPQPLGSQFVISVTDSADAAQFGLQMANLSRAGDDGATRTFVAPDVTGLEAGNQAMIPSAVPGVLEPNVSTTFPGAYPLTTLSYAAVIPATQTTAACADYANFIKYATGPGQTAGTEPGALPPGYAPMSPTLQLQGTSAAQSIIAGCAKSSAAPPTSPGASPSSTTSGGQKLPSASQTPVTHPPGGSGAGSSSPPGGAAGLTTPSTLPAPKISKPSSSINPTLANLGPPTTQPSGSTGRTSRSALGFVRYLLPILIVVGLVAALAARWLDVWIRRIRRPRLAI